MEHHVTAEKLEELKAELNVLKTTKRMDVADRLKRAKELGDLSENSEYFEAREEQQWVETRISEIEDIIKNAIVITMTHGKGTVQIGATIDVEVKGKKFKYTIVGANEARPEAGMISNESPLGKAFIGKKAGDEVKIKIPAGEATYKILKIE